MLTGTGNADALNLVDSSFTTAGNGGGGNGNGGGGNGNGGGGNGNGGGTATGTTTTGAFGDGHSDTTSQRRAYCQYVGATIARKRGLIGPNVDYPYCDLYQPETQ